MIALALLLVAAAAPLVSRRLTSDPFSPSAVVVSAWSGTLGLLALGLLPYRPLAATTVATIAATVGLLVAGAIAGTWLIDRRPAAPDVTEARLTHPALIVNAAALLGLVGVGWFLVAVVSRFSWEIFAQGPELRHKLGILAIPSHYLFLQFFCVVASLITWALILTGTRFRWWQLVLPAAAMLATLVTTDRTQFFTILVSGFFAYCFRWGSAVRVRRLAALTLAGLGIMVGTFIGIGIWTGRTAATSLITLDLPPAPAGSLRQLAQDGVQHGAMIYLYATCSYPSLDLMLAETPPWTAGAHTFYPLARLLQRTGLVDATLPPAIPPFVQVGPPEVPQLISNTYTFLYYPWQDFGTPGALAYSALVGVLAGAAYRLGPAAQAFPGSRAGGGAALHGARTDVLCEQVQQHRVVVFPDVDAGTVRGRVGPREYPPARALRRGHTPARSPARHRDGRSHFMYSDTICPLTIDASNCAMARRRPASPIRRRRAGSSMSRSRA